MLSIAFVGAGRVNFGGGDGPWDHASRLESIGGVQVIGIVDPVTSISKAVLEKRLSGKFNEIYRSCKLYSDTDELLNDCKPDMVFIGTPAMYRGNIESGKDLELKFVKAGIHVFVEKPISLVPPESFCKYVDAIKSAQEMSGSVVSVGYMFRYHAGITKMKELIKKHGGKVMAVNLRYNYSYSNTVSPVWWNIDISGGPIVEQATHFCDLARFLGGDVEPASVQAITLNESDAGGAGKLSGDYGDCEKDIAVHKRIPRVTSAFWRFKEGGVGSLMHTIALQGEKYETELDVLLDGMRLTLREPYQPDCTLSVRDDTSGTHDHKVYTFDDDPYATEIQTFLEACKTKDQTKIQSSYLDAAKTYNFTWDIRRAGEKSH